MIKINTSGDYVQLIYVDPVQQSVQQELKSDTDAFECSYDSEGKLYMQFGLMRFENPDPTDFTINGSVVTDAADFISKLNALFTGGGGGGTTIYTGDGSLSGDRTVDLNGNELEFISLHGVTFALYPTLGAQKVYMSAGNDDDTGASTFLGTANSDDGYKFNVSSFNGVNSVSILGSADNNSTTYTADTHTFNGAIINPTLIPLDFVDDAAAASGGVVVGQLYHTAGAVKIRLS